MLLLLHKFLLNSWFYTLYTLMEGNMFWNMVAISLICIPSIPKLFSTSSGWWVNCCSCILCLFKDETTSLMSVYWKWGGGKKSALFNKRQEIQCIIKPVISRYISAFTLNKSLYSHHTKMSSFVSECLKFTTVDTNRVSIP